ncbi:MAG TPA: T9SS type A sorting domain-containing protein [Ignavibacteria bacterium]|nr:T9SS type A sorting domain-containing protein [Ignavibacteria bacterium]
MLQLYSLFFLILLSLVFVSSSFAQYSSPESVTYDPVGKAYYVSNTSSSNIVKRTQDGTTSIFKNVGGSIHGITYYNGKVYVANGTRVRGYDLSNANEILNVQITGATFVNDVAIDSTNGMLYASDFSARRIYKVNTNTSEFWTWVGTTARQPNGLFVDKPRNRILACTWGASAIVYSIPLNDSANVQTILSTSYGNFDGISLDRNDHVYISTWSAQSVIRYDINFALPAFVVTSGLSNPADIYVNRWTDTLAIPNAGNNTLGLVQLTIPTSISDPVTKVESFELKQNYPNPFNPISNIEFSISNFGFTQLKIYNDLGKEVAVLVNEELPVGNYKVQWSAENLPSGIYYYTLSTKDFSETKKMILVK